MYFFTMIRGDTLSFGVEFDGLDQSLDTAFFTVRDSYDSSSPVFQKSIGDGIYNISLNQYGVRVAPEDTAGLTAGEYYFDLEISVNGDVFTVLNGVLNIEPDVTQEGN